MPNLNTIFTIVVCGQVSNISWKTLISDGPDNFFTRHFQKTNSRIVHIDRSPDTFHLIIKHLRGYSIRPKDECQYQDLLNDAVYFGLKKLVRLLKQFIYVNIGGTSFRLKWELFDKDGPHNYFTGPLKHLHSPHTHVGESMPIFIERDPETFKDMIRHLQGYEIHIRNEQHRLHLLSDAEFYLFRKLRDKLKSMTEEKEILLFAKDIKPSFIELRNQEVYYKQNYLLSIQIDDFNMSYHTFNNSFLLENTNNNNKLLLVKDPNWIISNKVELDKDCVIIFENQHFGIQHYLSHLKQQAKQCQLHSNCQIQWIGVEKSIAKVTASIDKTLFISFVKMQIIGSRTQANMKRHFLIQD